VVDVEGILHGSMLQVDAVPQGVHRYLSPLEEAADMMGTAQRVFIADPGDPIALVRALQLA